MYTSPFYEFSHSNPAKFDFSLPDKLSFSTFLFVFL